MSDAFPASAHAYARAADRNFAGDAAGLDMTPGVPLVMHYTKPPLQKRIRRPLVINWKGVAKWSGRTFALAFLGAYLTMEGTNLMIAAILGSIAWVALCLLLLSDRKSRS